MDFHFTGFGNRTLGKTKFHPIDCNHVTGSPSIHENYKKNVYVLEVASWETRNCWYHHVENTIKKNTDCLKWPRELWWWCWWMVISVTSITFQLSSLGQNILPFLGLAECRFLLHIQWRQPIRLGHEYFLMINIYMKDTFIPTAYKI